ncbi:aldo/keto reductase [Sphingobacterium sp. lm-10]|uniref:aldo/keto reductase n=1 Tax=Sphingobacterium sp. lm-10 TaxID=2944904 RepID=UPI002020365D|nr:aldo/keto reductase [Sphingobacterium sp. lm-10]MCL7986574.1 aldo/keto reductase [Sphingobacterium sp. lm-10]
MNRRNFLTAGAVASSAMALGVVGVASSCHADSKSTIDAVANMSRRTLGSGAHSIAVSAIGLGCMGMSYHRSFVPDKQAMISVIRNGADLGLNFFDTAEAYGPFVNESLVGEALKPIRKDITLATKFGFKGGKPSVGLDSRPERIRKVVEESLGRLQTDYIDLLYQHRIDPTIPIEDVAGTVKDLIAEGKVKHFGMSETDFSLTQDGLSLIRKAHAIQPVTAIQSEYSIMTRQPESEVLALCEELGIGFVPYSPLSRGLITGYINERTKYIPTNDNRPTLPRYQPEAILANWPMLDVLKEFGDQKGLTIAQVALAWLLAQKPFVVPIPGTTKLAHLQENLQAANYKFDADELAKLTADLSAIEIVGDRFS